MIQNKRLPFEVAGLLLLCMAVPAFLLPQTRTAPFNIDEVHKISESYYFDLFFIRHDLRHADWNRDFYARINPPVAKYIMGAYLTAQGRGITDRSLQRQV